MITDEDKKRVLSLIEEVTSKLEGMSSEDKVYYLNECRRMLHDVSPFKNEPIDLVEWVPSDAVHANDYNPNSVAPSEMELLEHSIDNDGFTQPVVSWLDSDSTYEVVDGFHRSTVVKQSDTVSQRLGGYVPVTRIKQANTDRNDRISSTIRHNRARGKHRVDSMSDIVVELKKRNWTDNKISKELGMEPDEVLRLCQVSGLTEVFQDEEFSQAWEAGGDHGEDDLYVLDEEEI